MSTTTVYSQVLIYTAESTGASMERTKMPNLRHGSKAGFERGLTWLRVRHSTTEIPRRITHCNDVIIIIMSSLLGIHDSLSPSVSVFRYIWNVFCWTSRTPSKCNARPNRCILQLKYCILHVYAWLRIVPKSIIAYSVAIGFGHQSEQSTNKTGRHCVSSCIFVPKTSQSTNTLWKSIFAPVDPMGHFFPTVLPISIIMIYVIRVSSNSRPSVK